MLCDVVLNLVPTPEMLDSGPDTDALLAAMQVLAFHTARLADRAHIIGRPNGETMTLLHGIASFAVTKLRHALNCCSTPRPVYVATAVHLCRRVVVTALRAWASTRARVLRVLLALLAGHVAPSAEQLSQSEAEAEKPWLAVLKEAVLMPGLLEAIVEPVWNGATDILSHAGPLNDLVTCPQGEELLQKALGAAMRVDSSTSHRPEAPTPPMQLVIMLQRELARVFNAERIPRFLSHTVRVVKAAIRCLEQRDAAPGDAPRSSSIVALVLPPLLVYVHKLFLHAGSEFVAQLKGCSQLLEVLPVLASHLSQCTRQPAAAVPGPHVSIVVASDGDEPAVRDIPWLEGLEGILAALTMAVARPTPAPPRTPFSGVDAAWLANPLFSEGKSLQEPPTQSALVVQDLLKLTARGQEWFDRWAEAAQPHASRCRRLSEQQAAKRAECVALAALLHHSKHCETIVRWVHGVGDTAGCWVHDVRLHLQGYC